jgi:hypothetical protein
MNSDLEQEFYCTLKLVSGEEIVSLIMVDDSDQEDPIIILQDPVILKYNVQGSYTELKIEPWMKLCNDDIFFIRLSNVITMSEIDDIELIELYKNFNDSKHEYLNDYDDEDNDSKNQRDVTKNMGFLGSVSETKKNLEKLFKIDIKDNHKEL